MKGEIQKKSDQCWIGDWGIIKGVWPSQIR